MQSLAAVVLNALNDLDELRVDLLARLDTADLVDDILGRLGGHDLGKLLRLLVLFDILETESHLDGIEKEFDILTILSKLGSRGDETLLAGQLA